MVETENIMLPNNLWVFLFVFLVLEKCLIIWLCIPIQIWKKSWDLDNSYKVGMLVSTELLKDVFDPRNPHLAG